MLNQLHLFKKLRSIEISDNYDYNNQTIHHDTLNELIINDDHNRIIDLNCENLRKIKFKDLENINFIIFQDSIDYLNTRKFTDQLKRFRNLQTLELIQQSEKITLTDLNNFRYLKKIRLVSSRKTYCEDPDVSKSLSDILRDFRIEIYLEGVKIC